MLVSEPNETGPKYLIHGAEVGRGILGADVVALFANGYVQVLRNTGGFKLRGEVEKLVAIKATANYHKKTATGRLAGAAVTGGLNLLFSNNRGELLLTITTDKSVHSVLSQRPSQTQVERLFELEAIGNSILEKTRPVPEVDSAGTSPESLSDQLVTLSQLRDSGALTEKEFDVAKKKVLGP
jgi:hypothetical protein